MAFAPKQAVVLPTTVLIDSMRGTIYSCRIDTKVAVATGLQADRIEQLINRSK